MRKTGRRSEGHDARLARRLKRASPSRRRQRDVLCDVMLSASRCDAWLTLDELAKLTHYPPASISAQLRHLRKPEFGGYAVEKQQRISGRVLRGEDFGTVWEYRLRRGARAIPRRRSVTQERVRSAAPAAA